MSAQHIKTWQERFAAANHERPSEAFLTHPMTEALRGENSDLRARIAELEADLGLARLALQQKEATLASAEAALSARQPVLDFQYSTDQGQTWTWSTDGEAEVKGWCALQVRYYCPTSQQRYTVMREVTDGQILESACAMLSLAFDEKDAIDFGRDVLRKARPILAQQGQES